MLTAEFAEQFRRANFKVGGNCEWFDRLYATCVRTRDDGRRRHSSKTPGEFFGLSTAAVGERSIAIIAVEFTSATCLCMTNEVHRHGQATYLIKVNDTSA